MRVVLISINVTGRRDVREALRHAAARARSEYPKVNNPVAYWGVLVHLGVALGTMQQIRQKHTVREMEQELALVRSQYLVTEAYCEDCVTDDVALSALNRSLQKNLDMDAGEFQCRIVTSYQRKEMA